MSGLLTTLEQLRARAEASIDSYLAADVDVERELTPLREAVARLRKAAQPETIVRPTTLYAARAKWATAAGRLDHLTGREIRALCSEEEVATDPTFVRALAAHGQLPKRRLWLEGMIAQYLLRWREMPEPHALEVLLKNAVQRFEGRSARIARCRDNPHCLFSGDAAEWLAESMLERHVAAEEFLGGWAVAPSSGLGKAAWNAAVNGWASRVKSAGERLSTAEAVTEFRYLTQALLTSDLVVLSAAGQALSAIVLAPATDRDPTVRDLVRSYIIASPRFGDPRLPANIGNWASCSVEARRKVSSWFCKEDLDFFFRVALPDRNDPHGRRRFWEKYLNRVVDCVVALSPEDHRRVVQSKASELLQYAKTTETRDVSAFLMRFQGATDLIVVEFSRPGNALRFHNVEAFQECIGDLRRQQPFRVSSDLKNDRSTVTKFTHSPNWESMVSMELAQHGIRQSR